jgi:hypothetical protein
MTDTPELELRRCDRCRGDRLCREYKDRWFCIAGPDRCWKHRRAIPKE